MQFFCIIILNIIICIELLKKDTVKKQLYRNLEVDLNP